MLMAAVEAHKRVNSTSFNPRACSVVGMDAPPSIEKWSHSNPSNLSRLIFVRRMRKAGSTTLRSFFATVAESRGWHVQANEFLSFNSRCLRNPLVAHRVLLVTHLREPLGRLNSEFYYVGPGSERGGSRNSTEGTWADWLDNTVLRKSQNTFEGLIRGGLYLDNIYVRALTGDCGTACLPPTVAREEELRNRRRLDIESTYENEARGSSSSSAKSRQLLGACSHLSSQPHQMTMMYFHWVEIGFRIIPSPQFLKVAFVTSQGAGFAAKNSVARTLLGSKCLFLPSNLRWPPPLSKVLTWCS
jgi:hypothetical protein